MVTNDALWKGIIEDLLEDFLAFFFPEAEFEKEVILITGKKNIMGVEEILLEQAKDQGIKIGEKKGLEKGVRKGRKKERLELSYILSKKLILKGESNEYICDLLDVDVEFVENIRKELVR